MKSSMKKVVVINLVHFHLHGQGQIVGVDNGEQATGTLQSVQEDGLWQRRNL